MVGGGKGSGKERRMTTMKSAEEFKQEALQAIKDLGGFPYNPDIYWSYRAVNDIPVWKEQYFPCKDCKHKDKYENFCWCFLREIDPSDYCCWAERKEK